MAVCVCFHFQILAILNTSCKPWWRKFSTWVLIYILFSQAKFMFAGLDCHWFVQRKHTHTHTHTSHKVMSVLQPYFHTFSPPPSNHVPSAPHITLVTHPTFVPTCHTIPLQAFDKTKPSQGNHNCIKPRQRYSKAFLCISQHPQKNRTQKFQLYLGPTSQSQRSDGLTCVLVRVGCNLAGCQAQVEEKNAWNKWKFQNHRNPKAVLDFGVQHHKIRSRTLYTRHLHSSGKPLPTQTKLETNVTCEQLLANGHLLLGECWPKILTPHPFWSIYFAARSTYPKSRHQKLYTTQWSVLLFWKRWNKIKMTLKWGFKQISAKQTSVGLHWLCIMWSLPDWCRLVKGRSGLGRRIWGQRGPEQGVWCGIWGWGSPTTTTRLPVYRCYGAAGKNLTCELPICAGQNICNMAHAQVPLLGTGKAGMNWPLFFSKINN